MSLLPPPPLTADQAEVVTRMANLARTRFAGRAARHDAESSFPYENYRELHEARLLALTVPRRWGGTGADAVAYAHALRELAHGCSATALTLNMHSTVTTFIDALGTEEQ
jgi:alkylation response protein AidB-like acyl-CoA dehydrogenase